MSVYISYLNMSAMSLTMDGHENMRGLRSLFLLQKAQLFLKQINKIILTRQEIGLPDDALGEGIGSTWLCSWDTGVLPVKLCFT